MTVRDVSATLQRSDDPVLANESGWNCRVHVEYEGLPAVDWYVREGAPIYATMDGTATLFMNTVTNAFDYWGVPREPYIGNPDRANAPVSAFPGPGGGMGVFIRIENDGYRVDYGHMSIAETAANVPGTAWIAGYSASTDWEGLYAVPRSYLVADPIAQWQVRAGDVIGFTGDAGYSEAPHLHYAITDKASGARLCPTDEAGFANGGWLFR
jgi:murein DD-endopeptidase MepM/ murein hydrolase activator NlpD